MCSTIYQLSECIYKLYIIIYSESSSPNFSRPTAAGKSIHFIAHISETEETRPQKILFQSVEYDWTSTAARVVICQKVTDRLPSVRKLNLSLRVAYINAVRLFPPSCIFFYIFLYFKNHFHYFFCIFFRSYSFLCAVLWWPVQWAFVAFLVTWNKYDDDDDFPFQPPLVDDHIKLTEILPWTLWLSGKTVICREFPSTFSDHIFCTIASRCNKAFSFYLVLVDQLAKYRTGRSLLTLKLMFWCENRQFIAYNA